MARAAVLSPYRTVFADTMLEPLCAIGSDWSRALFDGDFYRNPAPFEGDLPVVNLVFVQSRDGNTGATDPSSLGGGATDKHLIYEGLSRIDADAVLCGATTAKVDDLVFSVWHPELVSLRQRRRCPLRAFTPSGRRRWCDRTEHDGASCAQVVVTGRHSWICQRSRSIRARIRALRMFHGDDEGSPFRLLRGVTCRRMQPPVRHMIVEGVGTHYAFRKPAKAVPGFRNA